jgi:hypothetical protein
MLMQDNRFKEKVRKIKLSPLPPNKKDNFYLLTEYADAE